MSSLPIGNNKVLVAEKLHVPATVGASQHQPTAYIITYDRSGSMYSCIKELCETLKTHVKSLHPGDSITITWFSGRGQRGIVIKGVQIPASVDDKALKMIDKAIDANNTTIGSTCFSESLTDIVQHVNDLKGTYQNINFAFFSDGVPTDGSKQQELAAIHQAIAKAAPVLSTVLLIGYGDSYDRAMMSDMATRFGGALLHNEDMKEFGITLGNYVNQGVALGPMSTATVPAGAELVFSINGGNVVTYQPVKDTVSTRAHTLYYITSSGPSKGLELADPDAILKEELLLSGAYGAAIAYLQKNKVDLALDILNMVGDKAVMKRVMNAFTNSELGAAEKMLGDCIINPAVRFVEGRDTRFMPDPNAQCLVDVLYLLMDDGDSKFLPRHSSFEYKRIGRTKASTSGYPIFKADENASVSFSNLVWNKSKLNLSLLAHIPGTIELKEANGKTPESIGLQKTFSTFIYRNYAIIKDGLLNVKKLPVRCGPTTLSYLKMLDMIMPSDTNNADGVYVLDLTKVPLMNRSMAKNTSAKQMSRLALQELRLKAHMKVLKEMSKNGNEDEEDQSLPLVKLSAYTPDQEILLRANGIKPEDRSFNPPAARSDGNTEPTDFYMARSFELKIKGAASLPKVSDVRTKVKGGKNLNLAGKFMAQVLNTKATQVEAELERTKKELSRLSKQIQATKFAILLGNKWFDEFISREDCTMEMDEDIGGVSCQATVEFVMSAERVAFD